MLTSVCLLLFVASLQYEQVTAQQSYGAPASGYDSPAYSSPGADAGYAAPSDSYGGGYADYYDQGGYVATQGSGSLTILVFFYFGPVSIRKYPLNPRPST